MILPIFQFISTSEYFPITLELESGTNLICYSFVGHLEHKIFRFLICGEVVYENEDTLKQIIFRKIKDIYYKVTYNEFEAAFHNLLSLNFKLEYGFQSKTFISIEDFLVKLNNDTNGIRIVFGESVDKDINKYKEIFTQIIKFEQKKDLKVRNRNLVIRLFELENFFGEDFIRVDNELLYKYAPIKYKNNFSVVKKRAREYIEEYRRVKLEFCI